MYRCKHASMLLCFHGWVVFELGGGSDCFGIIAALFSGLIQDNV